jgi:phosphomethylpyrimidine synthase
MTNEENIKNPFPNSKKVHRDIHPIKVAMREITLADTKCQTVASKNPPITIYDTSTVH